MGVTPGGPWKSKVLESRREGDGQERPVYRSGGPACEVSSPVGSQRRGGTQR